ncbi:MAG: TMEM175 family protein [Lacunisphaera sp.]|nr:TMEM175 family protein [Lacunisphaera sp.]
MHKGRLEAFSDGVIAIIITIMVLEMKVPHGTDLGSLADTLPVFLSYVLSFVNVGLYWNNHHHLFQAVKQVNGAVLWANLHLLFWLSLFPFTTGWMGENHVATWPVAVYGMVLFMAGFAYFMLVRVLLAQHGADSALARAIQSGFKERLSIVIYLAAIGLSFLNPWLGIAGYVSVAVMWLVPDRRIERSLDRP